MKQVNIYVASTIKDLRKHDGKYIYLLEYETKNGPATFHEIKEFKNRSKLGAELAAVVAALEHINKPCDINIYVNTRQFETYFRHYLPTWAKHKWRKTDGKLITWGKNWQDIYKKASEHQILVHFKTHSYSNWLLKELGM